VQRVERVMESLPSLLGDACVAENSQLSHDSAVVDILADYFRIVEIAHYVRRGGIKAMIYRLETGKTKFVPVDYFDEAHERLTASYRKLYSPEQANQPPLMERLIAMTADEEEIVTRFLPQLDTFLLSDKRMEALLIDEP